MEVKLIEIGYNALAILIPVLVTIGIEFLRRKMGTEKMKKIQEELAAKKELADLAVKFVQQVWFDLSGPERFEKAAEWLAARAAEQGLKLSSDEIKGLIEAAIRLAKDQFGNEWGNKTPTQQVE